MKNYPVFLGDDDVKPAPARPVEMKHCFRGIPGQVERAFERLQGAFDPSHERIIEGIASTAATNKYGYALAPLGAEYELPMPLLLSHRWADPPIGEVFFLERSLTRIEFKARIATRGIHNVNDAWRRITSGQSIGVSTGFSHYGDSRHYRKGAPVYHKWRMCELSVCEDVGANPDARILRVSERVGGREIVHRDARPKTKAVRIR